jgi:hypothetical protein
MGRFEFVRQKVDFTKQVVSAELCLMGLEVAANLRHAQRPDLPA